MNEKEVSRHLSKNSVALKALEALGNVFMCYKNDLSLYISSLYSSKANMQSKVIKQLVDKGFALITEMGVGAKGNSSPEIISITAKGTNELIYHFPYCDYAGLAETAKKSIVTYSDQKRLVPRLVDNGLALFFEGSHVLSCLSHKPDLFYLYTHLPGQSAYVRSLYRQDDASFPFREPAGDDTNLDNADPIVCACFDEPHDAGIFSCVSVSPDMTSMPEHMDDEFDAQSDEEAHRLIGDCDKYLDNGLYYSRKEFCDFVLRLRGTLTPEGIEIDKSEMDALQQTRYKGIFIAGDKVALVYTPGESRSGLLLTIASIEENLIDLVHELFRYVLNIDSVDCLFVADSLDYANRLIHGAGGIDQSKGNASASRTRVLINESSLLFNRYYVVSSNLVGVKMMHYIATHSTSDYLDESRKLFMGHDDFRLTGKDYPCAVDKVTGEPAIYLPFIEAKMLANIYRANICPSIVADKRVCAHISKILKGQCRLFDENFEQVNPALSNEARKGSNGADEYDVLDSECDDDVSNEGPPSESEKQKRKYIRRRTLSLSTSESFARRIEAAARYEGLSVSAYMRRHLKPVVDETIRRKEEFARQMREAKKGMTKK